MKPGPSRVTINNYFLFRSSLSLSLSLSLFLSLFLIVSNLHFSNVEQSDFAYCNLPMTLHVRLLVGRCLMISLAQKFNFNAYEKMIKNFFKYI